MTSSHVHASYTDAFARVTALVAAARRLVTNDADAFAPDPSLIAALATSSGLHGESVRWALEHSLEWHAGAGACAALVAGAGEPVVAGPLVLVLSANVTTAALRALACAAARSSNVIVYPSSRDALFAELLVEKSGLPGLRIERDRDALPWGDASSLTVLYGSATTARELRATCAGPVEVHGPGLGIAVLTDDDDDAAMESLALDVAAFDQRGCLSPRLALHVGTPAHGESLAEALFASLRGLAAERPLGALDDRDRHERALYIQTARVLGQVWAAPDAVVVHRPESPAFDPGPAGRVLPVYTVSSWSQAHALLAPLAPIVSAVGASLESTRTCVFPDRLLRRSALGVMQRPAFDGPVDLRPHGPERAVSR